MLGSTDSSAEPKRPRHADGGDAGDDRLSALSDDLLRAILSRLKAQQTVRTCVLSTRWRHLLRAVPCLDIDRGYNTSHRFDDFTANLLHGHEFTLLEELRLHGATVVVGDRWLRRDIGRDTWPCRLKRLHLSGLELQLNDLASHISSSRCPPMEDVQLQQCCFLLTSNIKIASSTLKKLVVDGEYTLDEDDDEDEFEFEFDFFKLIIDAPALVSLHLGSEELHYIVDTTEPHTMPSLVDASIHLPWIDDDVKHQLGILGALSNVTTLHLLHFAVTLLFNESQEKLPLFKFKNLRTLFLDECRISGVFLGLQQYLRNSRNLQKLTLRHCKVLDLQPTEEVIIERRQSYSKDLAHFKCKKLRLCEIIYRDGDASVHLLVMFFVGISSNLPNNKIELTSLRRRKKKRNMI